MESTNNSEMVVTSLFPEEVQEQSDDTVRVVKRKRKKSTQSEELVLPYLECPSGYEITFEKGICYYDESEVIEISRTPFFISRKFVNVDEGTVEYEIAKYDGTQQKIVPVKTMTPVELGTKKILNLAHNDIDITSLNQKWCVRFLQDFRNYNAENFPRVKMYSGTGWREDGTFLKPYANDEYVVKGEELKKIYSSKGSAE